MYVQHAVQLSTLPFEISERSARHWHCTIAPVSLHDDTSAAAGGVGHSTLQVTSMPFLHTMGGPQEVPGKIGMPAWRSTVAGAEARFRLTDSVEDSARIPNVTFGCLQ